MPRSCWAFEGHLSRIITLWPLGCFFSTARPPKGDQSTPHQFDTSTNLNLPPIRATRRKRGKCLSRRRGQNPKLCIGTHSDGTRYWYFNVWLDIPGSDERKRRREIIGPVKTKSGGFTESQAETKKKLFCAELLARCGKLPSSKTFADAVRHYRKVFAPRYLRSSTYSVANTHLTKHLEGDWNNVPIDHINIEAVNDWAWEKRREGLAWVTIKNILRTMQRVLSASAESRTVPFSQDGLAIPERDKLEMKIKARKHVSYSWSRLCESSSVFERWRL